MRIPASTWYKDGAQRVEDIPGYVLCTHCRYCTMTKLNQIEEYGFWFCFYKRQWLNGDDLLQYKCEGFEMKSCRTCRNCYCKEHWEEKKSNAVWCDRYAEYVHAKRYYVGRPRRTINLTKDPVIRQMEKDLIAYRKKKLEEGDNNATKSIFNA